jgi:hypothetical protein
MAGMSINIQIPTSKLRRSGRAELPLCQARAIQVSAFDVRVDAFVPASGWLCFD